MVDKFCWPVGGTELAFVVVVKICVCHLFANARLSVSLVKSRFVLNRIMLTAGEPWLLGCLASRVSYSTGSQGSFYFITDLRNA